MYITLFVPFIPLVLTIISTILGTRIAYVAKINHAFMIKLIDVCEGEHTHVEMDINIPIQELLWIY